MQVITQMTGSNVFNIGLNSTYYLDPLLRAFGRFDEADHFKYTLDEIEKGFNSGEMLFYTDTYVDGSKMYVDAHIANKVFVKDDSEYTLRLSICHDTLSGTVPCVQLVLINENLARSQINATSLLDPIPINTPSLMTTIHMAIKDTGITFGTKEYCEKMIQFFHKYTQIVMGKERH